MRVIVWSDRAMFRVAACATALVVATISHGRVAPNPAPAYSTLSVASTNHELTSVADLIGNKIAVTTSSGVVEAYVWDVAFAKLPNGSVAYQRLEVQTPDNTWDIMEHESSAFPSGTTFPTSMSDVKAAGVIVYTDSEGVISWISQSQLNSIGGSISGGTISIPGGFGTGRAAGCWGTLKVYCADTLCYTSGGGGQLMYCHVSPLSGLCGCSAVSGGGPCFGWTSYECRSNSNCAYTCDDTGLWCECLP